MACSFNVCSFHVVRYEMTRYFMSCGRCLEQYGFKVTCDCLAANRRLIRPHAPRRNAEIVHKVTNHEDRDFFFFIDPPRLLKTIRNCFASKSRHLWVSCSSACEQYVHVHVHAHSCNAPCCKCTECLRFIMYMLNMHCSNIPSAGVILSNFISTKQTECSAVHKLKYPCCTGTCTSMYTCTGVLCSM